MANPTTYQERYANQGDHQDVASYFEAFDQNSAIPPGQRFAQFVDAPDTHPKILLYVVRDPLGHLLVRLLHGVFRFAALGGMTGSLLSRTMWTTNAA